MGTRADFYVGEEIRYLGSISWDGNDIPDSILKAETMEEFEEEVLKFLNSRDDGTIASKHGWPWPWQTSESTDFTYLFIRGMVWTSRYGGPFTNKNGEVINIEFPDMSSIQNVTFGSRSGLLLFNGS